jgi:Tfp pilus assembly protein PilO
VNAGLWWERRRIWLPAALFVLAGVVLLAGYELVLAGRLGLQAGTLASRRDQLEELSRRRRDSEALVNLGRSTRAAIDELYDRRLGTERSRLTAVMLEVKHLARQAGLSGMEAINYADQPVEGLPLLRKSITFSLRGSYQQLRTFIDLLELSPSFLSLDEIRVQGGESGVLGLTVRLSTLFVVPPGEGPQRASTATRGNA